MTKIGWPPFVSHENFWVCIYTQGHFSQRMKELSTFVPAVRGSPLNFESPTFCPTEFSTPENGFQLWLLKLGGNKLRTHCNWITSLTQFWEKLFFKSILEFELLLFLPIASAADWFLVFHVLGWCTSQEFWIFGPRGLTNLPTRNLLFLLWRTSGTALVLWNIWDLGIFFVFVSWWMVPPPTTPARKRTSSVKPETRPHKRLLPRHQITPSTITSD